MGGTELKRALWGTWGVITPLTMLALVLPFIAPEREVLEWASRLQSPHPSGYRCFLCGMTHSFLFITRGEWERAASSNPASLPLYGLFLLNSLLYLAMGWRFIRHYLKHGIIPL